MFKKFSCPNQLSLFHCRYGLSQFVVICPIEGAESLHSQAQANLMLSSVSIAITNTGWLFPLPPPLSLSSLFLYSFSSFPSLFPLTFLFPLSLVSSIASYLT